MKANELMVGDWLQHASGKYFQITRLDIWGDGSVHFACGHPHLWEYNNKFTPIPLTAEILEKNGFIQKQSEFINGDIGIIFTIRGFSFWSKKTIEIACGNGSRINNLPRYVHQLQHVLRLCNIEKEIEIWHDKKN